MKKIMQNINIIFVIIVTLLSTFLIGTPFYISNIYIVYMMIGIYSIFYYILSIIKKEKIITNKLDMFIGLLAFSSFIPLIFKTYASLSDTIYGIIKYFSIFNIYIIIKNECRKNPKNIDVLINTLIVSVLILCIIGLDEINGNYLEGFKKFINFSYVEFDQVRIASLFSNANVMAAITGVGIFLCFGCIEKNKNVIKKTIYSLFALIMIITFLLTFSRLAYIMFIVALILYFLALVKKYNLLKKINKKIVIISGLLIGVLVMYIIIGLQIPEKLVINEKYQKTLYSMQSDSDYIFTLDINAIAENENSIITIIIKEKNKYEDDIKDTVISFGAFEGVKEIKIHTQKNTVLAYFFIETSNGAKLIINDAKLNGEKFILKYKLLPTEIIERIQGINLNLKSVWERGEFITDALKIAKDNWLFGLGTNAWKYMQSEVQEYSYYASEVHCFILQVLLENGILGVLAYIGIGISILIYFVKKIKKNELDFITISVISGLIFITLHSLIDMSFSFFYALLQIYLLLAIIGSKEDNFTLKFEKLMAIVMSFISIFTIYTMSIKIYYKNNTDMLVVTSERTAVDIFDMYNKLLPFDSTIKLRRYKAINNEKVIDYKEKQKLLKDIILAEKYEISNVLLYNIKEYIYIELQNNDELENEFDFILDYISDTEEFAKYEPNYQIIRMNNILEIIDILKDYKIVKYVNELKSQLEKELKNKRECILDFQKCRYEEETKVEYERNLEMIENSINNI